MASQKERWLSQIYLSLHEKSKPEEALSLPLGIEALEAQNVIGTPDANLVDDRWIVQLAAMDRVTHAGFVAMLFLAIDKERAETVYGNIETLTLRKIQKLANEGGAVSAHLLIDLSQQAGLTGHIAALEDVEGLGRTKIVSYLRWLFGKYIPFVGKDAFGNDKNIVSYVASDIVLDRPINEQLNDAQLIAVDVFRKAKSGNIDGPREFYEKTRLIEYRPIKMAIGQKAKSIVKTILDLAPTEEYPEVRVRLKEPAGNERSIALDRQKADVLASAFQLRTFIGDIDPPLEEASKLIAQHFVAQMKEAIQTKPKGKRKV